MIRTAATITTTDSDQRLLTAIAAGDQAALAIFLRKHHQDLHQLARRWTRDAHLADEVVADVGLAVWTHAGAYQPLSTVRAWLFGITRNKAKQILRTTARRLQHESAQDLPLDLRAEVGAEPELVLLGYPSSSGLGAAFARLPLRLAEPLRLLFDHHLRYDEIAVVLDRPIGTVKRQIFEARARLNQTIRVEP